MPLHSFMADLGGIYCSVDAAVTDDGELIRIEDVIQFQHDALAMDKITVEHKGVSMTLRKAAEIAFADEWDSEVMASVRRDDRSARADARAYSSAAE